MNKATEDFLEILDHHDIPMPIGLIHHLANERENAASYRSFQRAKDPLIEHGMITPVEGTSFYRITESGRKYLSGELDASELES
jgi:predicted transcriptional regulator